MLIQNQFKSIQARTTENNLLIENSNYYSYGLVNPKGLSKLNFGGSNCLFCSEIP